MPTNRKRRTRNLKRAPGLPGAVRYALLEGDYDSLKPLSEDEKRQYWNWYRDELIAYCTQDPDSFVRGELSVWEYPNPPGPGHRPYSWWENEAPEERRVLDWSDIQVIEQKCLGAVKYENSCASHIPELCKETSYEYLLRLDLLTRAEHTWFAQFPNVTFDDWCLLFRNGWQCARGRTNHIRMWYRCLTEKGKAWARRELAYWDRLELNWPYPDNSAPEIFDVGYNKMQREE